MISFYKPKLNSCVVLLLVYFLLKEQGLTIENYNPDQINGYTVY
jgi:hypothetical protein